ncbi:MAG: hypothetical protein PHD64_12020 [Mesotoga sp.]|nr:hypothetical protein [Mesotoga sp.]
MSRFNWFGHQSRFVLPPPDMSLGGVPVLSSSMIFAPFVVPIVEQRCYGY